MFKHFIVLVIVIAIFLVALTIGADNDQVITFKYIISQSELQLSSLVAIIFGLGFILGWLLTGYFYLKLKLKNVALNRTVKRQTQQINELTSTRDKA